MSRYALFPSLAFTIKADMQVVKRRGEKMTADRDGPGPSERSQDRKRKNRDGEAGEAGDAQAGDRSNADKKPKTDKKDRKDKSKGKRSRDDASAQAPAEVAAPAPAEKKGLEKDGQSIGSLIGRKRRRKAGK
jgi:hypothetical protein